MSSVLAGHHDAGFQQPRFFHVPASTSFLAGDEALECARLAGMCLDEWQKFVVRHGLAERESGVPAAREVGACVPRQNGKGEIITVLQLYWLFVAGERFVVHSAHNFSTSREALRRLEYIVKATPEFHSRVARNGYRHSHGEEGIELKSGARIQFKTRTSSGGRGLAAPKLILDEAMYLSDEVMGALMPLMSAQPEGQMWYFGSAVDQVVHQDGRTFASVRESGWAKKDRIAYFEWSLDAATPDDVPVSALADPLIWAQTNPAFGVRISDEAVRTEMDRFPARTFAVERLGVGDWPAGDAGDDAVFDLDQWHRLEDHSSRAIDPVVFAFDVSPDRQFGSIAASSTSPVGGYHIEVVDRRAGTGWIPGRVAELATRHRPLAVLCDSISPAASLCKELDTLGVEVERVNGHDQAQACGVIFDRVAQGTVHHLGTPELEAAVRGAAKRPLGDSWGWSRKNSSVDISPLVACTLALWKAANQPVKEFAVAFA